MNGLKNIQDKIISDANAQAAEIISEAKQKADSLVKEAKENAQLSSQAAQEENGKAVDSIVKAAESSAHLQGKNKILKAKGEIMNEVIAKAHESILALPNNEYFSLIVNMVMKYSRDEEGLMLLNKKDLARLPQGYENEISRKSKGVLKISDKPCDIDGGFILVYGGIEENCSFDALFKMQYDKIRDKISPVLFK